MVDTRAQSAYKGFGEINFNFQEEGSIMADEKDGKVCKHSACSCPVSGDDDYCSPTCQGAGTTTQIDCDCGHPGCAGDF